MGLMTTQKDKKAQQETNSSEMEKEQNSTRKTSEESNVDNAPDVESLTEILHSNPTDIESDEAIDSIDEWVDFLKGHKEDNIKELSASLKNLKKLLKGKKSDGSEIAAALATLGEQTNAIGDEATRGVKGPLHTLGKALITFSHKVERAAAKDEE
jgi:hypothetical protein